MPFFFQNLNLIIHAEWQWEAGGTNVIAMKRLIFILVCLWGTCEFAISQTTTQTSGETESFRRSSLCLLLVTNQGDNYAKAIEEQFMAMPVPARYNDLNLNVRVLNIKKKATEKRIEAMLKDNAVAKQLVEKWFNRDSHGRMNLDRIHEWGGYNATFADLKRADNNVRGTAMLSDEGEDLIKNTFVMVCDISYYDRKNTGIALAAVAQAAGYTFGQITNDAQMRQSIQNAADAVSIATSDLAGFSVNIKAHLYRLNWSNELRDKIYGQYWVDEATPEDEAHQRRAAFDSDSQSFILEYLGSYRSRAGRTVSESVTSNLENVVREVCINAVNNSINNLAKMFPVFKAKTAFYCGENNNVYAYIGTKEGVTSKSKFELVETLKTKKGYEYKRVGTWRPVSIWDNKNMLISSDSLEQKYRGTLFSHSSGQRDVCDQGLLMREMGRLGYQYKRHNFYGGLHLGVSNVADSKFKNEINLPSDAYVQSIEHSNSFVFGFDMGWVWNFHSNIAWNIINASLYGGGSLLYVAGTTGVILRTNPLGKKGRWSFFVWPTIGVNTASDKAEVEYSRVTSHYNRNTRRTEYYTEYRTKKVSYSGVGFDWGVKAGVNITEHFFVCINKTPFHLGGTIGVLF